MQTMNDLDLELIFSLGDEVEKHCEGRGHPLGEFGHADGPLYYVSFPEHCKCNGGIQIRCDGWISQCERQLEVWSGFICPNCNEEWTIKRLEPIE